MKEILNTCYKFFNRFITAEVLVESIKDIDKTNLSKKDIEEIDKIVDGVEKLISETSEEVDEYVIKERETIDKLIKRIGNIPKDDNNREFLERELNKLKKEYERKRDSYERWFKITDFIDKNDYFNKSFESLNDYELLEFITQYIQAPFPPNITQEKFDDLVKAGISKDEKEMLWRLAINYARKGITSNEIIDYYITTKDGYYLAELISAIGEYLDIDKIIDNINDKELIEDLEKRKQVISYYVSDEQFKKLISKK